MDDMLKSIIEMDKKAQEKVNKVEQYRLEVIASLGERKNAIIQEENARAIESAKNKNQKSKSHNDKYLAEIKVKNERIIKNMDELFKSKRDEWVEHIFNETVGE